MVHTKRRLERVRKVVSGRQPGAIVLEDITDPHNAEAVFRSCDAFGIQQVCLIFNRMPPFDPLDVGKSTSTSANKWLDFSVYKSATECITDLHSQGYTVLSTVLSDEATEIYGVDLKDIRLPALMLGNERRGLSEEAISLSDSLVTIPMRGMVQSLNLSVSAAVFMFELTRQRLAQSGPTACLTNVQQNELLESFLGR